MTSKNDLIYAFNDLVGELRAWEENRDAYRTEIKDVLRGHADRLSALENAQNQPAPDPDELHNLRVGNDELLFQNRELTAANRRISEISTKRFNKIPDLRAENERLKELLAVTDQHAGEIVRALAVAEDETREMGK